MRYCQADLVTTANAEYLAPAELRPILQQHWAKQAAYVMAHSASYQRHFAGLKLTGDLAEIADLPFTDKDMLRNEQRDQPPFGSYLAADERDIVRMHRTSGTTGTAMNLAAGCLNDCCDWCAGAACIGIRA